MSIEHSGSLHPGSSRIRPLAGSAGSTTAYPRDGGSSGPTIRKVRRIILVSTRRRRGDADRHHLILRGPVRPSRSGRDHRDAMLGVTAAVDDRHPDPSPHPSGDPILPEPVAARSATPTRPASGPRAASNTCGLWPVSATGEGCANSRGPVDQQLAGPLTPPPITKTSGSRTAARLASPRPSHRPIAAEISTAAGIAFAGRPW